MEKFAKSGSIKLTKCLFVPAETGEEIRSDRRCGLVSLVLRVFR